MVPGSSRSYFTTSKENVGKKLKKTHNKNKKILKRESLYENTVREKHTDEERDHFEPVSSDLPSQVYL